LYIFIHFICVFVSFSNYATAQFNATLSPLLTFTISPTKIVKFYSKFSQ